MIKFALALGLMAFSLVARTQAITTLEQLTLQPTILAAKGIVSSCGIRFSGLAMQQGTKSGVDLIDGSIALDAGGYALVKAGFKTGDLSVGAGRLQLTDKKVAWMRIGSGTPLTPMNEKTINAEDAGFYLFASPIADGASAIEGFLEEKKFWIGFSGGKGQDRIFTGTARMDERTRTEFSSCLTELTSTLKEKK